MAEVYSNQLFLIAPAPVPFLSTTTPSQALAKTCKKCGETKHEGQFYDRGDGRKQAECKTCHKHRSHEDYLKRLDAARAQGRIYSRWKRAVIKEAVFQAYGGWRCACCGETERLFLTLDHIENNGAEERRKLTGKRTSAGYPTYMYLFANDFPPGYQILCMNCQHGKRMNQGVCPHQGRRNDYPATEYGQAPGSAQLPLRSGDDEIVCSASKGAAVLRGRMRKWRTA